MPGGGVGGFQIGRIRVKTSILIVAGAVAGVGLLGCEEKSTPDSGTSTKAADAATKAAESATDASAKAATAAKDAAASAAEAVKVLRADASNWVSETVDKQWPAAKARLDACATQLAGLTDPGVKAKAEALLAELKAQVPIVEELVNKVKNNSASAELGAMLKDAQAKFNGYMAKLNDLNGMLPK